MLSKHAILFFLLLCTCFIIYSCSIYFKPSYSTNELLSKNAADGHLVWQSYNCQSCHQLYGLGGYLGPDLTNLLSRSRRNESYIKSVVLSGVRQMPPFNLSEHEMKLLLAFLQEVDKTGKADPRAFTNTWYGMIEANEKK